MEKKIIESFCKRKSITLKSDVALAKLTTFRIGGNAKYVAYPDSERKLIKLLNYIRKNGFRYYVLGMGSNVLASDKGFDGIVVVTTRIKSVFYFRGVVSSSCGVSVTKLSQFAQSKGLQGAEFLYSLLGTVGGAIVGNSGCFLCEICDIISKVKVYYHGKTLWLRASECGFAYRASLFQSQDVVVLRAHFALLRGDKEQIAERMQTMRAKKLASQPLTSFSAGSIFLRGKAVPAKLIDNAKLKGYVIGGAEISKQHANFIVNNGVATAQNVLDLIGYVKLRIREEYNVELNTEIKLLGDFD